MIKESLGRNSNPDYFQELKFLRRLISVRCENVSASDGEQGGPSETLAWWARAAQARRVADMLPPRDAQLAEAYAVECEDQAREVLLDGPRSARSALAQSAAGLFLSLVRRHLPKQLLFCKDWRLPI